MTKILVIDDSKMMSRCLHQWLEAAGYEVEDWLPLSAMEISEHLIASAPDLILSDYQMPGCNGASLVRMVQKSTPQIPLLILTSFKTREMDANLQKFGVKQVLSKPIGAESLIKAVSEALGPAAQSPTLRASFRSAPPWPGMHSERCRAVWRSRPWSATAPR